MTVIDDLLAALASWWPMLEPWWPMLAAGLIGVALGYLLRRRGARQDHAAEPPQASPAPSGRDANSVEPTGDAQAQPSRPTATPTAVAPAAAPLSMEALLAERERRDPAPPRGDEPFVAFEAKLSEWQQIAREAAGANGVAGGAAGAVAADPSVDEWDDLMDIEGIDFDLARFLYAEGIHTFEQVAGMSSAQLHAVLERGGERHRHVDPAAWPASARRAIDNR